MEEIDLALTLKPSDNINIVECSRKTEVNSHTTRMQYSSMRSLLSEPKGKTPDMDEDTLELEVYGQIFEAVWQISNRLQPFIEAHGIPYMKLDILATAGAAIMDAYAAAVSLVDGDLGEAARLAEHANLMANRFPESEVLASSGPDPRWIE